MSDPWIDGNPEEFADFAKHAGDGPVVMINLLKFRERSKDGDGTGAEAYARYGELAREHVDAVGGRLIWAGRPTQTLVGDLAYDWDLVLLVEYPKRQCLIDLGAREGYQKIHHHRLNGLERTMLIACDAQGGELGAATASSS